MTQQDWAEADWAYDLAENARAAARGGAAGPAGPSGAARIAAPPAYATPDYSPPPTVRAPAGTDWDAAAAAFGAGMTGGATWGRGAGSPTSYYTAPPAYLEAYVAGVSRAAEGATAAQKAAADQNARAAQAILDAAGRSASALARPLPIVIDPGNPAFQLRLPQPDAAASRTGGLLGLPVWAWAVVGVGGYLLWRRAHRPKAGAA